MVVVVSSIVIRGLASIWEKSKLTSILPSERSGEYKQIGAGASSEPFYLNSGLDSNHTIDNKQRGNHASEPEAGILEASQQKICFGKDVPEWKTSTFMLVAFAGNVHIPFGKDHAEDFLPCSESLEISLSKIDPK
jgi:hypothetical protein